MVRTPAKARSPRRKRQRGDASTNVTLTSFTTPIRVMQENIKLAADRALNIPTRRSGRIAVNHKRDFDKRASPKSKRAKRGEFKSTMLYQPSGTLSFNPFILQYDPNDGDMPWMDRSDTRKRPHRFVPVPMSNTQLKVIEDMPHYYGHNVQWNDVASDFATAHLRYMHDVPWSQQVYYVAVSLLMHSTGAQVDSSFVIWWIGDDENAEQGHWSKPLIWDETNDQEFHQAVAFTSALINGTVGSTSRSKYMRSKPKLKFKEDEAYEGRAVEYFDDGQSLHEHFRATTSKGRRGTKVDVDDDDQFEPTMMMRYPRFKNWLNPQWIDWKAAKQIGQGSYGKVFEATLVLDGTAHKVAVKVGLLENSLFKIVLTNNETAHGLELNHPNLVTGFGWFVVGNWYGTVMEHMPYDLRSVVRASSAMAQAIKAHSDSMQTMETYFAQQQQQQESSQHYYQGLHMQMRQTAVQTAVESRDEMMNKIRAHYGLPSHFMPLQVNEILSHFIEVATGLEYIHGKNLVHRDIKPANVMISASGIAKIGDFGLIMNVSSSMDAVVAGSPVYMPDAIFEENRYMYDNPSIDVFALAQIIVRDVASRYKDLHQPVLDLAVEVRRHWKRWSAGEFKSELIGLASNVVVLRNGKRSSPVKSSPPRRGSGSPPKPVVLQSPQNRRGSTPPAQYHRRSPPTPAAQQQPYRRIQPSRVVAAVNRPRR